MGDPSDKGDTVSPASCVAQPLIQNTDFTNPAGDTWLPAGGGYAISGAAPSLSQMSAL